MLFSSPFPYLLTPVPIIGLPIIGLPYATQSDTELAVGD